MFTQPRAQGTFMSNKMTFLFFFPEQLLQGPSWLDEWSLSRMGAPGDDILAALGALPVFFSCQYRSWWFWVLYTQGTCKPSAPMNQ